MRTSRAARPPRPWPAEVAAATPGKGVALPAARSPPLARAGTNASGKRVCARVQRARGGPRCLKPRRGRRGGGAPAAARGRRGPRLLRPSARPPVVRQWFAVEAPSAPGPLGLPRNPTQESGPTSPRRDSVVTEQRDLGAGAAAGRLTAVSGKISAPLPPLPSPSSHPSTSFPRPALRRRGAGPPAASLSLRPWGRASVGRQPRPPQPTIRTAPRPRRGARALPRRSPIADALAAAATTAASGTIAARFFFFFFF